MDSVRPSLGQRYRIDVLTMPAYGHYMTTRDIAVALALRGHNVTLVLCDRSRKDYDADRLGERGVAFRSAGACSVYEEREAVMAKLIDGGSPAVLIQVLESVAELARQMCASLFPQYDALRGAGELPGVLVFDADTYCAMDLGIKYGIPRVARVGTGLRDAYTTPVYAPVYSSGAGSVMGWAGRLGNALNLLLSRTVFAPIILPNVYGRHRHEWLKDMQAPTVSYEPASATPGAGVSLDERTFRPSLLWDGVTTLYNSHWGLEHARPLSPYEHLIGHTNDFAASVGEPVDASLAAWLDAHADTEGVPTVYVGLGTLSVVPHRFLETLATAFAANKRARFVWSVPASHQGLLPDGIRALSRRAWCACSRPGTESAIGGCEGAAVGDRAACAAAAGPGSILLVEWAPQVPILLHPSVRVFVAHGGMNGIAEGTFARTPFLCIPFFSDQPDNCAHAADKGFAVALDWATATVDAVDGALTRLLTEPGFAEAVQTAWVYNVAGGGLARAVDLVEAAAALPYGAHLAAVPRHHFLPWYQAYDVDVLVVGFIALWAVVWSVVAVCKCCRRCWCRTERKEKDAGFKRD
jgi:UDP:flavonoid glycosyltransferase YjiC (YdhE family)